ncbi:PTS glucitol/sorbitol transporter subunit IIA [Tetragenococcus solitarius]|uniref:PTS glucitol/sorbitol transporter subunit IIA n=1 Tax=Tetragenococcus solitarius TaxID=71453 RepID=A0ABP6KNP0_9ENTE|nr:PTS glucitol/sorbitol transporter subunit IIA [Tetragenococcus solitarius]
MTIVFQTKVDKVGPFSGKFFNEGLLILFSSKDVMSEIKNYSVLTSGNNLMANIQAGQILNIGEIGFKIVAVGKIVQENLKNLGHVTVNTNNTPEEMLPGTIYVENKQLPEIKEGDNITITTEF